MLNTKTVPEAIERNDPLATRKLESAFFEGLRALWRDCGHDTNKHDQARILISACIDGGIDDGKRIVGILSHIGLNARYVGATLRHLCGPNAALHDWWKDDEGKYHLHENATQLEAASIVI